MFTPQKSMMVLKSRSQSTPSIKPITVPQPIHKSKFLNKQQIQSKNQNIQALPVISFFSSKNKEEEVINNKIKIISERNLKKLEGRYETIDRWKQRYLSESNYLSSKYKPLIREQIQQNNELNDHHIQDNSETTTKKMLTKLMPILSKHPINPEMPNHHEQSKKLQNQLLARLQKNKRYYEKKNCQIFKEINYFEQSDEMASAQKRRQLDIKKAMTNPESRKNSMLHIFNKKITYKKSTHPEIDIVKESLKKKLAYNNYEETSCLQPTMKIKLQRSKSIYEYKRALMEQAVHQTPEGWEASQEHFSQNLQGIE